MSVVVLYGRSRWECPRFPPRPLASVRVCASDQARRAFTVHIHAARSARSRCLLSMEGGGRIVGRLGTRPPREDGSHRTAQQNPSESHLPVNSCWWWRMTGAVVDDVAACPASGAVVDEPPPPFALLLLLRAMTAAVEVL